MDDEELTRLAAEELIRDAKKFVAKREAEFRANQQKRMMQTNKTFLHNVLRNTMQHNNQIKMNQLKKKILLNRAKQLHATVEEPKADTPNEQQNEKS